MPVLNVEALINNRVTAIQRYHEHTGIRRAELDVSGGIDSAVMLMLLALALGQDEVTAVYSCINSSEESRERARLVADAAGVRLAEVEAGGAYEALVDAAFGALREAGFDMREIKHRIAADPAIMGSLRSTLRAPLGRFMNRLTGGGIRHGTGNEDEDRWLRFYQKGGDGEVDTNPLAMLSKGEVYQLAVALGVPRKIIEALPTPDLWGNGETHNDEDELAKISGVEWTYSRVDPTTGRYVRVGTIERMSRFLDTILAAAVKIEDVVFGRIVLEEEHPGTVWRTVFDAAAEYGLTPQHVDSAAKWERTTRHKMNPNCPALDAFVVSGIGTGEIRQRLLNAGILTDELPEV